MRFTSCVFCLVLTCILALGVSGAVAGAPTDAIKGVIDQVIDILNDPALKSPAQKERRRQLVKQNIDRRFDYEEMAKRCLGASWRTLNAGQRAEFVPLFGELLEASYSDKILKYSGEKVSFVGERLDGEYAEVQTLLQRRNDKIPMNYRLLQHNGGWMVYDIVIEGVSLVSNYRSQFGHVISESSYAELVRRLRTKVNELRQIERM